MNRFLRMAENTFPKFLLNDKPGRRPREEGGKISNWTDQRADDFNNLLGNSFYHSYMRANASNRNHHRLFSYNSNF